MLTNYILVEPKHDERRGKVEKYYRFFTDAPTLPRSTTHHHPLFTSVGFANLLPKLTVTRLCNATVLISNGSPVACCAGAAVVSATGVGTGALAATWLCATAVVDAEEEEEIVSAAAADVAARLEASAADEEAAEDATEADPGAIILTASPALLVVLPATNPTGVNVAEFTLTLLVLLLGAMTPEAGAPPATTVTAALATVCMVLPAEAPLIDANWKGCASGACMGKEPAGHMQRQLQPPFSAAAVAAAAVPVPATTVTADPAAVVVEAPARPTAARPALFFELVEAEDGDAAAAAAEAVPFPEPATTVTGPAAGAPAADAPASAEVEVEELFIPEPEPAWTVIVAPAAKAPALFVPLAGAVPFPASTVTAAAVAPAALVEPLVEGPMELEVPFPTA
jgi:hypothetical protein